MLILGIESSCDDLSMALLSEGKLLGNVTASQTQDHAPYGGVVPEIASRRHLDTLQPTLDLLLQQTGRSLEDLQGIAATFAPGLVGSLLVGLNFAKSLAYSLELPFRGVHHIEGHLWSPFLEHAPQFPLLGLVVSGGHTHLFFVKDFGDYELLGHTVDDAAGEAFDKIAKLMGLGFPGGPAIEKLAREGNPKAFSFANPHVKANPLHTSFSGMKTAALEYWNQGQGDGSALQKLRADLAASFQASIVRALSSMVERALDRCSVRQLVLAGGVACNGPLREAFRQISQHRNLELVLPSPRFCTDNGAMIAYVGEQYLKRGQLSPWELNAKARLPLGA